MSANIETYPLTAGMEMNGKAVGLQKYEALGGYEGAKKALLQMGPAQVMQEVKDSNLRGRGGAGFPTGQKWSFVPMGENAPNTRYLVVNADEMEPGAFKDKFLLEGNPHQLIEGMVISSYAIGASVSYVFLRWAYKEAAKRIEQAISEAHSKGYLGKNIFGSGFDHEVRLHTSAGRYICGEETALLTALEGKRGIPRAKPPFPQICGLWGKPTVVNNVETMANVPHIIRNGAKWFKEISRSSDGGTKIYGASGRVNRPGAWELPMGTPLRELLEIHAGGMKDGYKLKGIMPGGASTEFMLEEHLDTPMDFDSVPKAGSRLGTGTLMVMDHKTCPVGLVLNIMEFFARESCGWCTPCREGLPWLTGILRKVEHGDGNPEDLEILNEHIPLLGMGRTFCALAPGAIEPLQSALKYYKQDFEAHIEKKTCPYK